MTIYSSVSTNRLERQNYIVGNTLGDGQANMSLPLQ
jgi:hypothetical protein